MTLVALIVIPMTFGNCGQRDRPPLPEFTSNNSRITSARQRSRGRNVRRSHRDESLQRRRRKASKSLTTSNNTLYDVAWKSQFLSGLMMPIMMFIGNLGYVAVVVLGGYLTVARPSPSAIFKPLFNTSARSHSRSPNWQTSPTSCSRRPRRRSASLNSSRKRKNSRNRRPVILETVTGHVEFKDVHFGYSPDKIIINDFSAEAKPGRKSPSSDRPARARLPWSSC
jgi:ATP-binding cassette subfamily B multidrug efflux pump